MAKGVERKLTTILAADAEGFSRRMGEDEVGTFDALHDARAVFSKFIDRHHGRIANTAGDGLIAEFPSVVEAVQCAIEVQRELSDSRHGPADGLRFRIGIHLGDVMVDGSDLLGEGVNLAARLQTMAEPGGVLISQQVYDQVQSKLSVGFEYLGEKRPKNFAEDVPVYRVAPQGKARWAAAGKRPSHPKAAVGDVTPAESGDLRERVINHARMIGVAWVALFVIDLVTGPPAWAIWPGLGAVGILGLEAAPLLAGGWIRTQFLRAGVIVGILAVINIVTWDGYPWVLWPAGVLVVFEAIRRFGKRRH